MELIDYSTCRILVRSCCLLVCSTHNSSLEFPCICSGIHKSHLLAYAQYEMEHFVLHDNFETFYFESFSNDETLYIGLYNQNKYETSSMIYYDNQSLEHVSSLHDICNMEFSLSSYNMCDKSFIFICPTKRVENRSVCYEFIFFAFVLSSDNKYIISECCKLKNETQIHHRFFDYILFSLFLTISKWNILEYLFYCFSLKTYDYVASWFEQCLINNLSFLYNYCVSIIERKREKMFKKFDKKKPSSANECIEGNTYRNSYFFAGGRHQIAVNGEIVYEYLQTCTKSKLLDDSEYFKGKEFDFKGYQPLSAVSIDILEPIIPLFYSTIPLDQLSVYLNKKELRDISILHKISIPARADKTKILTYFCDHYCTQCHLYVSVLTERMAIKKVQSKKETKERKKEIIKNSYDEPSKFPPDPPSNALLESIIRGFCNDTAPKKIIEGGCAVCGTLSPVDDMVLLDEMNCDDLSMISPGDIGRYERLHESDSIMPLNGPILAENCDHVCQTCQGFLKKKKMPPESLANSFWIGPIPLVLQNLTFAEKMLISRIRHNKCLVRVSSGRAKMTANVIMFSNPTVEVYHALPPSRRDISEILAFVFQGPVQPNESDIKRTPMLVRRNKVKDALEWLKLNHTDYEDLHISLENLNDYPLVGVPVNIEYSKSDPDSGNKIASAMSVYDNEFEDGTTDGPCPFTVHGLTGPEFENMSMDRLKARALQHLAENGSTLGISHDSKPQSMYDNPQAYPQMFPWLFPYGFGGIGQKCHFAKISETTQKKNLLMYHDKRFQTDFYFPMIAFNHEQLKAGVTGSFLLTKRKMWPGISNRLKSLNHDVLKIISDKLSNGAHFSPSTPEEKNCFRLLHDLDHVGGFVKGSITSKKYMRNEIWSIISQMGAPSWFITLSPADSRHPICLYYADKNIEFRPNLRLSNERNLLVAQNPVAAARFFDLMIRMFIKHVLGIGVEHSGLYGNTAGYYGTVEQQGRLTLHLHMILWIENALSPQEIRNKIMDKDDEFQQNLIQYLEGCQKGEFLTGTMEYVKEKIPIDVENRTKGIHTIFDDKLTQFNEKYKDPTQILPEEPPYLRESNDNSTCNDCRSLTHWWSKFSDTVDDILLRSNVHKCSSSDSEKSRFKAKGCLNKDGICKARFPRPIVPQTTVNFEDGYITLKKIESMLNTITPCITYLFRCNTDVTSLLSGTSMKAVISYVTDYIAKPSLKTHQIFATAYNIFDKNANLHADDVSRTDDARKLILKIVNALSTKMEIGSPMASMYLLQNPDHYTSHKFISFWWKSFVNETFNGTTIHNHDIDTIMEDVPQEERKKNPFYNNEEHDGHDIDIKMEVLREVQENISLINHNNNDENREIHEYHTNAFKLNIKTSPTDNMPMDIDSLNSFGGGPNVVPIKRIIDEKFIREDTKNNDQFENHDENIDMDKNKAISEDEDEEEKEDDPIDEVLLISQDGMDFVASSKVDDYKYRPEVYGSSSLHEWSKLSVKVKASQNNKRNMYLPFLLGHGQRNSHVIKLIPSRSETFVLNFIGGPLPRRDQGDFEYYCCTMLTLFKPWRKNQDLKDVRESWAEAFASYEFETKDTKIMNNFNLRYECLDERDDYHAILKRQSKMKEKETSSYFQDHYDNDGDFGLHPNFEEDYGDQKFLGPKAIRKAQQMIEAEIMINKAGWLDDDKNISWPLNVQEFRPVVHQTGSQWKIIVKQSRQNILNVKKINYSSPEGASQEIKKGILQPLTVRLLSAHYFMHNFHIIKEKDREIVSNIIVDFSLNKEQKRSFNIIANHASETCPEQLKMYLGGMGGTGKTQVIKALISMFDHRQENHRFIVLAPTGTAAALLNGSTYHSILGIQSFKNNDGEESLRNENTVIKEVQERLEGVDYIFIDEISMIACHELYSISSQLSKVTNEHNKPFGGKNIILAGDFAQLPPTNGSPLYSNTVIQPQKKSMSKRDQESAIGKILWHQMTTVVILTQNMRQTEMSEDNKKFRTALMNMRYAACTTDDLVFLNTLYANKSINHKSLTSPNFRNVSIITSLNTQKDQINESCSIRFARDTNQELTHFYSIDKLGNADLERKKRRSRTSKKISANIDISDDIQQTLWDSSPHSSEHFPGKLSLCLGMPMMIRNNDATELCITKGQEAYVVGWDATDGPKGRKFLETLYLELKNPPKTVQLPFLPVNVIPMTLTSKKIKCDLPNDYEINIIRQQINVLPNFSMTDYASQGKTRFQNPVNLSHCRNFQSIYTCLSRSSNAAGTLIVQGCNPDKITKGLPGHLRQEFRELQLLDNITKEIFEGQLNKAYFGPLRNPMLYKYRTEIKKKDSNNLHHSLTLPDEEYVIKNKGHEEDGTWNPNVYQKLLHLNTNGRELKRKLPGLHTIDQGAYREDSYKKKKLSLTSSQNLIGQSPIGLNWDDKDYSCAYDSLFTGLYHIWNEGELSHKTYFGSGTPLMQILHSRFTSLLNENCTFESVRDHLRSKLHFQKPTQYRYGTNYTDIDELVRDLTSTKSYGTSCLRCPNCQSSIEKQCVYLGDYTSVGWSSSDRDELQTASIQRYLNFKLIKKDERTKIFCLECHNSIGKYFSLCETQYLDELPSVLIFALAPWIDINKYLEFDVSNLLKKYILKAIIYSNGDHFTVKLVDKNLTVWHHDGQVTRSICRKDQSLIHLDDIVPLKIYGRYKAIMAFYAEI